jgi:transposase-like protein
VTNTLTVATPLPSAAKPRSRVNWTAVERAEWMTMFDKSGQSASEFCRTNDLPAATLSLWRSQKKGDAGGTGNDECGGLVEVPTSALVGTQDAMAVRIQLPNGVHLEVPTGTDPPWLGAVLKTLLTVRS